jgi:hypothetical protein
MTGKVHAMTGQTHGTYNTRQGAYDLRKLRGKHLVAKPARTRRYHVPGLAARTISALLTLRDHVIAPILAGVKTRRHDHVPARLTPHRPGLRTPPNRHGHPVQAPRHPARSSRRIALRTTKLLEILESQAAKWHWGQASRPNTGALVLSGVMAHYV